MRGRGHGIPKLTVAFENPMGDSILATLYSASGYLSVTSYDGLG